MGDNLVPNGLSRDCKAFCSRSKYPKPAGWEVRRVRWPVSSGVASSHGSLCKSWFRVIVYRLLLGPCEEELFSGR